MPWLDVWVNEAEIIARKLHEFHSTITTKTNSEAQNDSMNGGEPVKKIKIEGETNIGKRSRANSI